MKAQGLVACINGGSAIYADASDFLKSSITWFEDDIDPEEYMVEILRPDEIEQIDVTFVKKSEFYSRCYNTDFTETIKQSDEKNFIEELCTNSNIFNERADRNGNRMYQL